MRASLSISPTRYIVSSANHNIDIILTTTLYTYTGYPLNAVVNSPYSMASHIYCPPCSTSCPDVNCHPYGPSHVSLSLDTQHPQGIDHTKNTSHREHDASPSAPHVPFDFFDRVGVQQLGRSLTSQSQAIIRVVDRPSAEQAASPTPSISSQITVATRKDTLKLPSAEEHVENNPSSPGHVAVSSVENVTS